MTIDIAQLAVVITSALAPFTPYLMEGGKKFAQGAGQAGWEKAQDLWGKIKARWGDDKAIQGTAMLVSADPENNDWQTQLAKTLALRLEKDPEFAKELIDAFGGESVVQQVLAINTSWVSNVTQAIEGSRGKQEVKADNKSNISSVNQSIKR
jgi:hypothetical protein